MSRVLNESSSCKNTSAPERTAQSHTGTRTPRPNALGRTTSLDMSNPLDNLSEPRLKPLIKWPGGKRWLLNELLPLIQHPNGRYYEPFVGGGAVFFGLRPKKATLSDVNIELINLYKQLRDDPTRLLKTVSQFKNSESEYYRLRESSPKTDVARAARLLYLTRLSFNGIYRVNRQGQFNVPYGATQRSEVCDANHLFEISRALQRIKLLGLDFECATSDAKAGDTVYFDPPYSVAYGVSGFLKYNDNIFSWADQIRLRDHALKLGRRGVRVFISNADHESITSLYKGFTQRTVSRFSTIAASNKHRRVVTELLLSIGAESK